MTVRIRFQRQGKPKRPFYRLVAIDKRSRRDGAPIEILGHYDPMAVTDKIVVKRERVDYWLKQGAKSTETVAALLKIGKPVIHAPKKKKGEQKEEPKQAPAAAQPAQQPAPQAEQPKA